MTDHPAKTTKQEREGGGGGGGGEPCPVASFIYTHFKGTQSHTHSGQWRLTLSVHMIDSNYKNRQTPMNMTASFQPFKRCCALSFLSFQKMWPRGLFWENISLPYVCFHMISTTEQAYEVSAIWDGGINLKEKPFTGSNISFTWTSLAHETKS